MFFTLAMAYPARYCKIGNLAMTYIAKLLPEVKHSAILMKIHHFKY